MKKIFDKLTIFNYFCPMNQNKLYILLLGGFLMIFSSCGQYQKALKTEDLSVKYEMAETLYKKGDYNRAERLFEQIVTPYLGKPQGERVLFMYADGFYQRRRYLLAAYQFEKFLKNYPKSIKAQEVAFLEGKCYFLEAPKYSLSQDETYKAIDKIQSFIDKYPNSEYVREANNMMLELLTKLQRKSFEIAKGYHKIKDFQAAIKSFDNFLIENPGSSFKEEVLFLKLHSAYELASNSVKSKEKQRFEDAKSVYENFTRLFPNSPYREKADKMAIEINKKLTQLQ